MRSHGAREYISFAGSQLREDVQNKEKDGSKCGSTSIKHYAYTTITIMLLSHLRSVLTMDLTLSFFKSVYD